MFIGKNSFSLLIYLLYLKYFNAKVYYVVCAVGKSIIKLSIYGNHIYLKKKKKTSTVTNGVGGSSVTLMMLKVIGFIVLNERKLKVFKSNRNPLNYKTFKFNRKLFCINNSMLNLQKQNKYLES